MILTLYHLLLSIATFFRKKYRRFLHFFIIFCKNRQYKGKLWYLSYNLTRGMGYFSVIRLINNTSTTMTPTPSMPNTDAKTIRSTL